MEVRPSSPVFGLPTGHPPPSSLCYFLHQVVVAQRAHLRVGSSRLVKEYFETSLEQHLGHRWEQVEPGSSSRTECRNDLAECLVSWGLKTTAKRRIETQLWPTQAIPDSECF